MDKYQELINNILYSSHIIIMAKGVMNIYPFYSYEEGDWLIKAMKINVDRDWNKELIGLIIYKKDVLVFSKEYKVWVDRNYLTLSNVFIEGNWLNELSELRDKVINKLRLEEVYKNNSILKELRNVK